MTKHNPANPLPWVPMSGNVICPIGIFREFQSEIFYHRTSRRASICPLASESHQSTNAAEYIEIQQTTRCQKLCLDGLHVARSDVFLLAPDEASVVMDFSRGHDVVEPPLLTDFLLCFLCLLRGGLVSLIVAALKTYSTLVANSSARRKARLSE